MGRYGLGHWRVLSLASDFRAVWLVWIQVGERASGKAFGAETIRLMLRFRELLNKVWDLGLVLLIGCSGGAYELLFMVWFWRGYRARGLMWSVCVVLNDSWCVVVLL